MKDNWFRRELKARTGLSFAWGNSTVPGVFTIEARHQQQPAPVGIVWYGRPGNSTIEIQHSFVVERARRCGVRTWLHEQMLKGFPKVRRFITAAGTRQSRPWLVKMGFSKNLASLDWELAVNKNKRKAICITKTEEKRRRAIPSSARDTTTKSRSEKFIP